MAYSNLIAPMIEAFKDFYGQFKSVVSRVVKLENNDQAKDRAIASIKAENALKDKKIKELEERIIRIEKVYNSKSRN